MMSEGRPAMAGTDGADLSGAAWRKSRRSSAESSNCVEVARVGGIFAVRDSKNPDEASLVFDHHAWSTFTDGMKRSQFDNM